MKTAASKSGIRPLFSGLVPLFVLAHFAHHLLNAILVPLLPMIRSDFGLDYTQSGFVVSAFNLSYGLSQLPAGWATDRVGPRTMITLAICGVAVAGLLVGLSQTYVTLIVFLILMGVLGGGYHPATPAPISAAVEPKQRGQALGLHLIGGSASFFLSPLIAAAIAGVWGWRGAFISLSVPTVIFGIAFYVLMGRNTATGRADVKKTGHLEAAATGRLRRLATVIVLVTFGQAVISSVRSFIPLLLVDHFGVSSGIAAASVSVIFSAGFWAAPLGGYLSDRWGRIPLIVALSFVAGPIVYLVNLATYWWAVVALLVAVGVVTSAYAPSVQAYIIEQTSERNRSMMLGVYFFGSIEAGGVFTPVMGYLIDRLGFYSAFTIAGAALLAIAVVCSLLLLGNRESRHQAYFR